MELVSWEQIVWPLRKLLSVVGCLMCLQPLTSVSDKTF